MPSHDEIAETIESQGEIFNQAAVTEASWIEEIVNRAHEIRRARGGLFGYDLEDWLQAQRELTERNGADQFQPKKHGTRDRRTEIKRGIAKNALDSTIRRRLQQIVLASIFIFAERGTSAVPVCADRFHASQLISPASSVSSALGTESPYLGSVPTGQRRTRFSSFHSATLWIAD